MISVISKDGDWSWANNEHALKPLRQARTAITGFKDSSRFFQEWLVTDNFTSMARKKYDRKTIEEEFGRLGELEKRTSRLSQESACLKRMHQARSS